MNRNLTQTSRAALLAAALAVPTLALSVPALAQTATDTTGQDAAGGSPAMDDALTDDTLIEGTGTETDTDMTDPLAAPTGLDNGLDTMTEPAEGTAGTDPGSAGMDQLTYERILSDLRTGRDFSDQLDGMTDTDTVTIMGLTELEQTAQDGTAMDGAAPDGTGLDGAAGDDTAGDAMTTTPEPAEGTTLDAAPGDAAAGAEPPAGMADDTGADPAADLGAEPGADTAMDPMGAPEDDIDAALEQADDSLTAMREQLADHEAVTQALEDEGYTADDVIALHRDDTGLTVVVDDRDD